MHQAFFMRVHYSTFSVQLFNFFIAQAFTLFKTISTAKTKRQMNQGIHTLARKILNKNT